MSIQTSQIETFIEKPKRKGILVGLSLCMLLSSLGTSIANVGLPTLGDAFSATFQEVQWVVIAYLLATTTLIVAIGRLGDMIGRRRLLLGGIAAFTIASALCAAAPALWMLIAARALQGLGAAAMMALAMAFVGETVTKDKIGSAMGLLGTTSAVGTALGPSLGGFLISGLGWPAIFLINVPLGTLAFLLVRSTLPADRGNDGCKPERFDLTGTILLAATLAAYALAMTIGRSNFGLLNVALLGLAGLGTAAFVMAETRTAFPLIRLSMIRKPALAAGLVMSLLVSTVMMATLVVGPFYLSRTLGLGAALVGVVLSIGPVISTLSGIPAGRMIDRLGAPSMVTAGLAVMAAGCFALCFLPALFGIGGYVAAVAILTPGYQLFQAANNTAVMLDVQLGQRGVVSGVVSLSRNLGLVTGASLMGAIFAWASGKADLSRTAAEAVATGMQITFAVAALLVLVALAIGIRSRTLSLAGMGDMGA